MKTLIKFFFTFLIPVQIIFAQEQHIYSQKETAYVNYIKPTNQPAYPWADREHRVGYWSGGYDVANFNYWEWTQNIIPIEATVTSVNIKFRAIKNNYLHTFKFYLYNIPYGLNSGINLYDQCTINNRVFTSEVYNPNTNYEVFVDLTFTPQSPVGNGWEVWNAINNAVKSGNYYFTLGIREAPNSIYPTWNLIQFENPADLFKPAIDLTIYYTTPNNYYTFKNKIQSTENYGNLILNNDLLHPIASGIDTLFLSWGSQNSIRTAELPFLVNWNSTNTTQKYNYWDLQSSGYDYSLHHNFQAIPSSPSELKAIFLPTVNTFIKNIAVEFNSLNFGNIGFKDPWFYYKDANLNWYQSNEFKNYLSPLNIQNNSLTSYGGVFLNQVPDPNNPNKPYYSVKADYVQNIQLQQTGRTHKFYFQGWSATPEGSATFQNANAVETPVVFNQGNATVQTILNF
ncbi:MAG: hypothetical protein HZC46_13365 [Ignavibacterium album]|uniref:hypothetical protein n=1 Tax=Ignavibacterium album TaxID=591197 RepID=UPI0026EE0D15|nr:hypothetical protein [Ignavibacterium album]MBI5663123.1 hypothetical protein [Ignavibacterium album]